MTSRAAPMIDPRPRPRHLFLRQESNINLLGWVDAFLAEHLPREAPHAD